MEQRIPARAIWALGITQIIGYGSLYYSFSVLAPAIGASFSWPAEWIYGALTVALLAGGLLAPVAGHLADRFGAAQTMTAGSAAAAVALALAGLAPNGPLFAAALVAMEIASTGVLYATAFAALVQTGGHGAQRSITHLTLIAGFASTLFWPLSSTLLEAVGWRGTYFVFAGLNLLVCAPLHLWLARLRPPEAPAGTPAPTLTPAAAPALPMSRRRLGFGLMLCGFALEGFILSAVLMQIIPLLSGLGLAGSSLLVTSLFGPAQVLSRLTNMLFGRNLPATGLALIAALLLPLGTALLAATAPSLPGALLFAVAFGLGSGLLSIVSGSLPLHLLGRENYGTRLGWLSAARQVASAVAPFCLALLSSWLGATGSLWAVVALGLAGVGLFLLLALLPGRAAPTEDALLAASVTPN